MNVSNIAHVKVKKSRSLPCPRDQTLQDNAASRNAFMSTEWAHLRSALCECYRLFSTVADHWFFGWPISPAQRGCRIPSLHLHPPPSFFLMQSFFKLPVLMNSTSASQKWTKDFEDLSEKLMFKHRHCALSERWVAINSTLCRQGNPVIAR